MGNPLAGFLLGHHVIKPGLQAISYRRRGMLGIEERKGVLDLAAVSAQLMRPIPRSSAGPEPTMRPCWPP
jgi:hypothetical protein